MIKNKKFVLFSVVLVFVAVLVIYMVCTFTNATPSHTIVSAKTDGYENREQLTIASDCIIVGTKTGEETSLDIKNEFGGIGLVGTISEFSITRVIKNDTSNTLRKGAKIRIFENEGYNKKSNTIYHVNGYLKMGTGKKYILYLRYSPTDNWYTPMGVTFGKIPIDKSEKVKLNEGGTYEQQVANEVRSDYMENKLIE
jgi:hypothetical protein